MYRNKVLGFTLVEVVLACSIFAIVVVGIILAINRSFAFMNNTKLSVRAANLAREGVEMMYNIRDTNWRRHSGKRDEYWLNLGDHRTEYSNLSFTPGIYTLKEDSGDGNKFLYAEEINGVDSDSFYSLGGFFSDTYSGKIEKARLTFSGVFSYYSGDIEMTGSINDEMVGGGLEFYRIVRVFGVYCKSSDSSDQLKDASHCKNDSDPKEMRFCVKVFYRGNGEHASELCSIMTNFME